MFDGDDYIQKLLEEAMNGAAEEEKKIIKKQKQAIEKREEEEETGEYRILYEDDHKRIVEYSHKPIPVYELKHVRLGKKEEEIFRELYNSFLDETQIIDEAHMTREFVRSFLEDKIKEIAPNLSKGEKELIIRTILSRSFGYGELQPFIEDDDLEEIMVIGTNKPVYVYHRNYHMCETNLVFEDDKPIMHIIERIAMQTGRRIDQQTPLLDARLKDGSRVNATIPPISLEGPTVTIRKFRKDPLTIIDLINYRSVSVEIAAFLWLAVDGLGVRPANILVSGGTGSGKTTLLNSLSLFIPPADRVITIEDTAELQLVVDHWVRLETRPANIEGKGEVTMDDLIKNTLRMRPDRIIVGEVRGPEARTLFTALNTGHDGGMGTVHANSSRETVVRLTNAPMSVPLIMIPALNFIIMQNRFHTRKAGTVRRITEIAEITGIENDNIALSKIYEYDAATDTIKPTGVPIKYFETLSKMSGRNLKDLKIDMETRALILDYLRAKGIRSIKEVGNYIRWFYMNPDSLIAKIEEEVEANPDLMNIE